MLNQHFHLVVFLHYRSTASKQTKGEQLRKAILIDAKGLPPKFLLRGSFTESAFLIEGVRIKKQGCMQHKLLAIPTCRQRNGHFILWTRSNIRVKGNFACGFTILTFAFKQCLLVLNSQSRNHLAVDRFFASQ